MLLLRNHIMPGPLRQCRRDDDGRESLLLVATVSEHSPPHVRQYHAPKPRRPLQLFLAGTGILGELIDLQIASEPVDYPVDGRSNIEGLPLVEAVLLPLFPPLL